MEGKMEGKNIYKILAGIQKELKVPKTHYNEFGDFYYRDMENILEAVKPLLGEALLVIDNDIVAIGGRFYVKAKAILSLNGESISVNGFAREVESKTKMDAPQITATAASYAGKRALGGLLLLDDTKDADFLNTGEKESAPKPSPKPTPKPTQKPAPKPTQKAGDNDFDESKKLIADVEKLRQALYLYCMVSENGEPSEEEKETLADTLERISKSDDGKFRGIRRLSQIKSVKQAFVLRRKLEEEMKPQEEFFK